jgi:hypothetical protein
MRYELPVEVRHLVHARNELRRRYVAYGLSFTPDGNLVGDLGEAIAAELFDLQLAPRRGLKGIDAHTKEAAPRSVQIKATGRGDSLIFTHTDAPADLLIGLVLDYEREQVEVVYNGPYDLKLFEFEDIWLGQRSQRVSRFRRWNVDVLPERRLKSEFQPLPML